MSGYRDRTPTEFLFARIAEDEAAAKDELDFQSVHDRDPTRPGDPARVLAECDAKRRIVEECRYEQERRSGKPSPRAKSLGRFVLHRLTLPYAGHPDYREEWRP